MLPAWDGVPRGHLNQNEVRFLRQYGKGKILGLEIGSLYGRSTVALAEGMEGRLFCIDPWEDEAIFREWQQNVLHLSPVVSLRGTSDAQGQRLLDNPLGGRFDFVFIDGDHSEEQVRRDIILALKLLRADGEILGHDYKPGRWDGVVRAVDAILPHRRLIPGTTLWIATANP